MPFQIIYNLDFGERRITVTSGVAKGGHLGARALGAQQHTFGSNFKRIFKQ